MNNGISISFNLDELPGDGQVCSNCGDPITGQSFTPTLSVGVAPLPSVTDFDKVYCENCYIRLFPNREQSE